MPQHWHYFYKIANYFSCSPLGRPFPTLAAGLSSSLRAEVGSFLGRPSKNSPCSTTSSQVGPFTPFFKICRGLILVSSAVSELRKKLNPLLVDIGYERLVSRFLCFVDSVFFHVRPDTRLYCLFENVFLASFSPLESADFLLSPCLAFANAVKFLRVFSFL